MGRKKIEITPITDAVKRRNTLKKRIRGVMKKLVELNTLCGTDIMLIAINNNMDEAHPKKAENHWVQTYCSTNDPLEFWKTYMATTRKKAKVIRTIFDPSILNEKSDPE